MYLYYKNNFINNFKMAEYKPVGSEKLNSDDKLKRILELTYYNRENKSSLKTELVKESTNGGVYGIVKEKDGYYVKRGINESSLDYIGGMFMKNKNRFSSYAEALKRLELLRGAELNEATKYVLKKNNTQQQEAPLPSPSMDMPPAPSNDMPPSPSAEMPPSDAAPAEPSADMPPSDEQGGETAQPKRSDYMAEIQKYAGKLGQELRDQIDRMESDDIKYVLNMIISAVDLDKLELEDLEDIGKKFERDEEAQPESEPSAEEMPEPEQPESVEPEGDLGEIDDPMVKLERFVDSDMYSEGDMYEDMYSEGDMYEDMYSEGDMYEDISAHEMNDDSIEEDEVIELDMNEIQKQISQSVNDTLSKYFR